MIELMYWLIFGVFSYLITVISDMIISIDFVNNYFIVVEYNKCSIAFKYTIKIIGFFVFYLGYASVVKFVFPNIYNQIFIDE